MMATASDLTAVLRAHTLKPVFRALTAVVALAMISTSVSAALQHVHAYAGHKHADHEHGLASHVHVAGAHHDGADDREHGGNARLEACDPAVHAVSVILAFDVPHPDQAPVPGTVEQVIVAPPKGEWRSLAPTDVRAHSPPRLTDAPLRAPPVVHLT